MNVNDWGDFLRAEPLTLVCQARRQVFSSRGCVCRKRCFPLSALPAGRRHCRTPSSWARLWDAVQNLGLSCVTLPGWARARLLFGTGWTGLIRNRPISFPSQLSRGQDESLGLGLPHAAWRQIMLGLAVAGMGLHVCVTEKRFCWLTNCCLCNVFGN